MEARLSKALKLYKFTKPDVLNSEGARLPEAYKKFYREWRMTQPTPVHYRPVPHKWVRDERTGEVKRVDNLNTPIPLFFPPESNMGIWGGEGVIRGFQKRTRCKQRVPHFWVPNLKKSAVYSEILDKKMSLTVTERTIDLIFEHKGFDNYILETKACDLQSLLALKLKKLMLEALFKKNLYPEDSNKREEVFNKYKHFLDQYSEEDIDWYGLDINEALTKLKKFDLAAMKPVPHKISFREELLLKLQYEMEQQLSEKDDSTDKSWLNKINPFKKK